MTRHERKHRYYQSSRPRTPPSPSLSESVQSSSTSVQSSMEAMDMDYPRQKTRSIAKEWERRVKALLAEHGLDHYLEMSSPLDASKDPTGKNIEKDLLQAQLMVLGSITDRTVVQEMERAKPQWLYSDMSPRSTFRLASTVMMKRDTKIMDEWMQRNNEEALRQGERLDGYRQRISELEQKLGLSGFSDRESQPASRHNGRAPATQERPQTLGEELARAERYYY